jgi:hypothetical protein
MLETLLAGIPEYIRENVRKKVEEQYFAPDVTVTWTGYDFVRIAGEYSYVILKGIGEFVAVDPDMRMPMIRRFHIRIESDAFDHRHRPLHVWDSLS